MRRYGSFLVRWWQAGPEARRLTIRHVQSDEELTVAALSEALEWMSAHVAEAVRDPPGSAGGGGASGGGTLAGDLGGSPER